MGRNFRRPGPVKQKQLTEGFPKLTSLKESKTFLGLANNHRLLQQKFIRNCKEEQRIANNSSIKKNIKFRWSESFADAFKQLKVALILAPVLAFPSFSKQFSVYVQPAEVSLLHKFRMVKSY